MKKLFLTLCFFLLFSMAIEAQVQQPTDTVRRDIQVQSPGNRAARQADVNANNNRNVIQAEDRLRNETERSTGKEMKNPAQTNPKTVKPPVLSDPVTSPVGTTNH